jgi:uncharacterized protein involved in outer membrane biogenesis
MQSKPRRRVWPFVLGAVAAAIVVLILVWDWDWFRPLVEGQASAALGRRVTMTHFGLRLGWHPVATAQGVTVADPDGFPEAPYFAHIDDLAVTGDVRDYLHGRRIVLTRIAVQHPDVNAIQHADGHATWDFPALTGGPAKPASSGGPPVQIGDLVITDGHAHVVDPKLRADFGLGIATRDPADGKPGQIVVDADGRYAGQKITGQATGGALLTLRDAKSPYPIDAHFANGPTKVSLDGTVSDPLHFAGTHLRLHLSGPDMALLYPLTGIPIPRTPPYDIAGQLAYADKQIRFSDFRGRLGSSDIGGTIAVDPTTPQRPTVTADLVSQRVDLADLGGFIGSQPGRTTTPDQTPAQKRAVERAVASPQLLPTTPIDVPKLTAADVHLRYHADHVEGRSVPFDTFASTLDIVDGKIAVHPVTLGVAEGRIVGNIDLAPAQHAEFTTKSTVTFERVDIGRMLAATHLVHGAGLLGGEVTLDSTGNSVATLVGHGDGGIKLLLAGGNLSALLVDLSGLELGNAILSALGIPNRAALQCLAVDMALHDGVLRTQTFLIDTSEADVLGSGDIDLARERLDFQVRTLSRSFSVGSLPTPIRITGTFKDPHIAPAAGPLAVRTGEAIGLGVLLTPLAALLPTVQFGTGKANLNRCEAVVRQDERTLPRAALPPTHGVAMARP